MDFLCLLFLKMKSIVEVSIMQSYAIMDVAMKGQKYSFLQEEKYFMVEELQKVMGIIQYFI